MSQRHATPKLILALALAALVVLAGCSGGQQVSAGGSGDGGAAPESGAAPSASGGAGGSYYDGDERVVVRSADIRIEVSEFETAFDRARDIARTNGGFVADWYRESDGDWDSGRLVIKVPAGNFNDARDGLTELGAVEHENVRQQDFTQRYQDVESRLESLRTEERELLSLLNRTDDASEAAAVHDDLREVRRRISDLENRKRGIERREALSTVELSIHEPPGEKPPKNYQSAFGFDDAFLDAFYGGVGVLKYVVVLFGYAIPVGVSLILLGAFAFTCFRAFGFLRYHLDSLLPSVPERADGAGEAADASGAGEVGGASGTDRVTDDGAGGGVTDDGANGGVTDDGANGGVDGDAESDEE